VKYVPEREVLQCHAEMDRGPRRVEVVEERAVEALAGVEGMVLDQVVTVCVRTAEPGLPTSVGLRATR
jgi:hypothetical protein